MKAAVDRELFWFLKDGAALDLSDTRNFDLVVQQTVVRGKTLDIRTLIARAGLPAIAESMGRIKGFLPPEIRMFWEEYFGNTDRHSA